MLIFVSWWPSCKPSVEGCNERPRYPKDQTAQQDLTPEAGLDALSLSIEESALAMAQLRAGQLAHAVDACQRARKALDAVSHSAKTFLSGGLPGSAAPMINSRLHCFKT